MWDCHLRDRAAPLSPPCHPRRRGGRGGGLAPRPIKGRAAEGSGTERGGSGHGKGRADSPGSGAAPAGAGPFPPAPLGKHLLPGGLIKVRSGGHTASPALFPLTCPKRASQPQRSPPGPELRRAAPALPAPRESSAPSGRVAPGSSQGCSRVTAAALTSSRRYFYFKISSPFFFFFSNNKLTCQRQKRITLPPPPE